MITYRLGLAVVGIALTTPSLATKDTAPTTVQKLEDGVVLETPKNWKFSRFENPATKMPELKRLGIKGVDWRFDSGSMRIGITYMFVPGSGMSSKKKTPEERLHVGMAQYLPAAIEDKPAPILFKNVSVDGVFGTLHAKEGNSFPVFYGRSYRCVTTALATKGDSLFITSVGSDDCESDEHKLAVTVISRMHD